MNAPTVDLKKHFMGTPGPWTHQTHKLGNPAFYNVELVVSEVREHPTPVCEMIQSTEAWANARLCAAAPDLLNACLALLTFIQARNITWRSDDPYAKSAVEAAISAINKATWQAIE